MGHTTPEVRASSGSVDEVLAQVQARHPDFNPGTHGGRREWTPESCRVSVTDVPWDEHSGLCVPLLLFLIFHFGMGTG